MVFNATCFSSIVAVSVTGGWNKEYPEKTTDLPQVTDKFASSLNGVRKYNFSGDRHWLHK
jgi:hypothetical protein